MPASANAADNQTVLAYLVLEGEPTVGAALAESPAKPSRMKAAAKARDTQIMAQQAALTSKLSAAGVRVMGRYSRLANVVKVRVPVSMLDQLKGWPGVARVQPVRIYHVETAVSVGFVGAPQVWAGGPNGADGEGIRIGIIDTGIDYTHADFGGAGDPSDFNANDPTWIEPGSFPTAKVVGGYDFAGNSYDPSSSDPVIATPFPDPDPLDCDGHGTHVAGIVAGLGVLTNGLTYHGSYSESLDMTQFLIGPGMAPRAKLYALKVFGCGGGTDLVLDALEWAADPNGDGDFSDHLDVVNLSLGTSFGQVSQDDVMLQAVDHLVELGCVVVAAAGNSGNVHYIVDEPGVANRAISVASSIDDRSIPSEFEVLQPAGIAGTYVAVEGELTQPLSKTGPIVGKVVQVAPADACGDLTNAAGIAGQIALIDRGNCNFTDKVLRAQKAGAIAIIMVNSVDGPPMVMGGSVDGIAIPGVMITKADGVILRGALASGLRVRLDSTLIALNSKFTDQISEFSSRGPSSPSSLLKPDLAAPGSGIVSAAVGTGAAGIAMDGTSMATPHVSGAAALLRQLHPDWPVADIKAALMNTAAPMLNANSASYPESRIGAGRLRVNLAAQTEVTIAAEDNPGLVSLSFGSLNLSKPVSLRREVRLTNHGTNSVAFDISVTPTVSEKGAELKSISSTVTVPPDGTVSLPFELGADPSLFDRTDDATTPASANGQPRQTLYESSGEIQFISSGTSLHLPYHAVLQAGSVFSATVTNLGVALGTNLATVTIPVRGMSANLGPLASVFQLGATSPRQSWGDPVYDSADLLAVGAATDIAVKGSITNSTLYFGIATANSWTSPQNFLVNLEVLIDSDHDGMIDFGLVNSSASALAASDLENPDMANDVLLTVIRDQATGSLSSGGYLNIFPADERDTAPFNNSVLVLSAPAASLGLSDGHSTFSYKVVSRKPGDDSLLDQTGWILFDAANPGVDTAVFGLGGRPVQTDGTPIKVQVNRSASASAGFTAENPPKILILHHFNPPGARFDIIGLDLATDDADGDGMPDAWEIEQFGDLTTANSTSDHDGDGFSDLFEFRAGTDPNASDSLLRIVSVSPAAPNAINVRWTSAPGKFYTLERAEGLGSGSFQPIAQRLPTTPPVNVCTDTNALGVGPFYYRVKID